MRMAHNVRKNILIIGLIYSLAGAAGAENLAPQNVAGARTISTVTAKLFFDKGYPFIDVRGPDDFNKEHIPGAYHLPVRGDFDAQNLSAIVNKDQAVVIYCNGISCMGSSMAAQKAVEWGWSKVFYYREGIKDLKQQGYPVYSVTPE